MGQGQACYLFVFLMLGPCFLSFGLGLEQVEQFHLVLWFVITVAGGPMVLFPMIVMQCIYFHIFVTALVDLYMGIPRLRREVILEV